MDMNLQQILAENEQLRELHVADLPALDLYMDQIITLVDDTYRVHQTQDKTLTKPMINNYSKEGIIKPIRGKKYTKEQVLQMLTIYKLKNTLSIQQIKTVFAQVQTEADFDLATAWENAQTAHVAVKNRLPSLLEDVLAPCQDGADATQTLATLLAVNALASDCQRITQRLVAQLEQDLQ